MLKPSLTNDEIDIDDITSFESDTITAAPSFESQTGKSTHHVVYLLVLSK